MRVLDANGVYFADLNKNIRDTLSAGETEIYLKNVAGQRYIGDGIKGRHKLIIEGVPGNDMAAYMDGPELVVKGNAQDAIANTMNSGRIIVHGNAGDTVGYGMRGGEIFIKGNAGYRVGIHMKEYGEKKPVLVIGGKTGDFLGEYMAGGIIIVLGMNSREDEELVGNLCGTGMHGGSIFIRGNVDPRKLGKEVAVVEPDDQELQVVQNYIKRFSQYFDVNYDSIMERKFLKLHAFNKRPYGNLYAY